MGKREKKGGGEHLLTKYTKEKLLGKIQSELCTISHNHESFKKQKSCLHEINYGEEKRRKRKHFWTK